MCQAHQETPPQSSTARNTIIRMLQPVDQFQRQQSISMA
jgi:hypothetical protein